MLERFASPRELGFLPVEVNASDTRNKSDAKVKAGIGGKLSNAVRELATNSAIGAGTDGRPKRVCEVSLTHVEFCPIDAGLIIDLCCCRCSA